MMQADTEAKIRQRAYEIWLREGRPHGRDQEHWSMARRELTAHGDPAERPPEGPVAPDKPKRKKAAPTATTQAMSTGKASAKPRRPRQPKKT